MTHDATTASAPTCLTLREVSAITGKKIRTVRRWIRRGKFIEPRRGPGGQLVFLRHEVDAFLAALPTATEAPLAIGFAAAKE